MPFDAGKPLSGDGLLKIAVIGSGISGLSSAWLLSSKHHVTLYEAAHRLGGHTNTVHVPVAGALVPIDAGFIVYNEPNYPNLTAIFDHLGVPTEESCMSFAASMRGGEVEYSGQSLSSVFANRSNIVSPSFWWMLADIVRFHRLAKKRLKTGLSDDTSLRDFIVAENFSDAFARDFLEPIAAAIWSTPSSDILDYPAGSFFRFFDNHGLLQVLNMPVWRTVTGGASEYVEKLSTPFLENARLGYGVTNVKRDAGKVIVTDETGGVDRFDQVVIATHADAALRMLENPSEHERDILGAFRYQSNRAIVHFDNSQMPKKRRAWASWNYLGADGGASVSYWMNRLQNLDCEKDIFVTLNPLIPVRDEDIVAEFDYEHPMFNITAGRAQKEFWSLQGRGGVWFCGAHFGQGFHEDGLQSGLAVAEALGGVRRPWQVANESGRIHLPQSRPALAAE